ncbi:MAG TPA: ABC transporter ATP-binding protein, partial [Polyangia bacterium]
MTGEDAPPVRARGLVKRYDDVLAVDHIDLNVQAGDVYGFLGPN